MVRQHHRLNGHEFEQTPGDSEGQESLECSSQWGCKQSDTTQRLDNNNDNIRVFMWDQVIYPTSVYMLLLFLVKLCHGHLCMFLDKQIITTTVTTSV